MALSIETIRNSILTSIHGRRLGLGFNGELRGHTGGVDVVEEVGYLATGTSCLPYGMTVITSPANGGTSQAGTAFTLQTPIPGMRKTIFHHGASTSAHVFGLSGSAKIVGGSLTSAGTTMFSTFRQNACVQLLAITTAMWLNLVSKSSANVSSDMWGISYSATVSS